MSDERVWLRHTEHGGTFECPAGAVDEWAEMGWEQCDAPAEPVSAVVAENLAAQEAAAAAQAPASKSSRKGGADTTSQEK